MLTPEQKESLTVMAAAAVAAERKYGFPAEVTVAQAIFESAWGTRAPGNNYFGIKADGYGNGTQYELTHEYLLGHWQKMPQAFEKYACADDSFCDHARLLTSGKPYAEAWARYQQDHDLDRFIKAFCPVYATDPNYTAKILAESHSSTVQMAVQTARASAIAMQPKQEQ